MITPVQMLIVGKEATDITTDKSPAIPFHLVLQQKNIITITLKCAEHIISA